MEQLTTLEILELDGIVIQKVPEYTTSKFRIWKENQVIPEGAEIIDENGQQFYITRKLNSLVGYLVSFDNSQSATINRHLRRTGVGSTLVEAYYDYLSKMESN